MKQSQNPEIPMRTIIPPACPMMKTLLVATALCCSLGSAVAAPISSVNGPSLSGGTLLDFEGLSESDGTSVYAATGVKFSSPVGVPVIDNGPIYNGGYTASSGLGVLATAFVSPAIPRGIGIDFMSAVGFIEFFFSDTAPLNLYTFTALDASSAVLESFTLPFASVKADSSWWLGFSRDSSDISRVTIVPTNTTDAFAVDDLRFGATPVSEPATLSLLVLGLLGLGAVRRKQSLRSSRSAGVGLDLDCGDPHV